MTHEILYDVLVKLAGPIRPIGDHGADGARYENLRALTLALENVMQDIREVSYLATAPQASMQRIGRLAAQFLAEVRDSIPETDNDGRA